MTDLEGDLLAEVVKPARWPLTTPVSISAHHVHGEPISYDAAMGGAYEIGSP